MTRRTAARLAILSLFVLPLTGCSYNTFVSQDQAIKTQWAQVQNQLQRRNDLIPNLVNTVKGYAAHETGVFEAVANARAKLLGAGTREGQIEAAEQLQGALGRLLAIAEQYPQLKANEQFNRLSDELAGTENRIAVERRKYNETVQKYNTQIELFPNNIVASMSGFSRNDAYFKTDPGARTAPKVAF